MQTTETMSRTDAARTILNCPDWCELEVGRHTPEVEVEAGALVVWHFRPLGLLLSASADTRNGAVGEVTVEVEEASSLTADELRRLSRDALAAAEWLEAHQ